MTCADWLSGWLDHLRTSTAAGRKVERVRLLAEPLTQYQQWALTLAPENVKAGEDLRLIEHDTASTLDLPPYDFVIVDDRIVARMNFSPEGFTGANLIDDADEIARHREWRTQAWQHAITVSADTSRSP